MCTKSNGLLKRSRPLLQNSDRIVCGRQFEHRQHPSQRLARLVLAMQVGFAVRDQIHGNLSASQIETVHIDSNRTPGKHSPRDGQSKRPRAAVQGSAAERTCDNALTDNTCQSPRHTHAEPSDSRTPSPPVNSGSGRALSSSTSSRTTGRWFRLAAQCRAVWPVCAQATNSTTEPSAAALVLTKNRRGKHSNTQARVPTPGTPKLTSNLHSRA